MPAPAPAPDPAAAATATKRLAAGATAPEPMAWFTGTVVRVDDGDSLVLRVDGDDVRVRLAQVDAPERGQPWADRARQALAGRVLHRAVRADVLDRDDYGRLVATVWLGERDVNRELVAEGHAWVYVQYLRDPTLLDAEAAARGAARGLWSLPQPVPPWQWRRGSRHAPARPPPATGAMPAPQPARPALPARPGGCEVRRMCRDLGGCAQAREYFRRCNATHLDGDGDGVPCEALCR